MKKLASLILALILCLGLASTALAEGETVAVVLKTLSSEYLELRHGRLRCGRGGSGHHGDGYRPRRRERYFRPGFHD